MPALKLSDRERKLMYVTAGFVIFYVFYLVLLSPKLDELSKLKSQLARSRSELKVVESQVQTLRAMGAEDIAARARSLGADREESALYILSTISETISRSRLKLLSIKPLIKRSDDFQYEMTCSGSYQDFYEFLVQLRDLDILIGINSLSVAGEEKALSNLQISMLVTAQYN